MTVLQSTVHERAPQQDKSHTTYETTRWLVSFLVTYNPASISFVAVGGLPLAGRGVMPVNTDQSIRDYLEEPRGQLVVRSVSNPSLTQLQLANPANDPKSIVISSPSKGRRCDVRNGPFCRVNSIQHIAGERLWKIHLTFETYVTGTSAGQKRGLILNNRWSVTSDINWQHVTTRVYQGICTVNANLLNDSTVGFAGNPGYRSGVMDSIRQSFAGFTVPYGFQRTFVKVEMTPDGNNAAYVVRDEEQLYSKPGDPNVPRIEVHDSNWLQKMGWGAAVASNMNPLAASIALSAQRLGLSTRAAMALAQPVMLPTTAMAVGVAQIPKMSRTVIVRIWGNQLKARGDLVSRGMAIAAARLGRIAVFDVATAEIVVSGDSNNLVMVTWTTKWGRENAYGDFTNFVLDGGGTTVGGTKSSGSSAWVNSLGKKLDFNLPNNNVMTATPSKNPPFPNQGGTAGTAVGDKIAPLITQVLESFGAAPGSVP